MSTDDYESFIEIDAAAGTTVAPTSFSPNVFPCSRPITLTFEAKGSLSADDAPFQCFHWARRLRPKSGRLRRRRSGSAAPSRLVLAPKRRPGRKRKKGNRFGGFSLLDRLRSIRTYQQSNAFAYLEIFEIARAVREKLLPQKLRVGRLGDQWQDHLVESAMGMLRDVGVDSQLIDEHLPERLRRAIRSCGASYRHHLACDDLWFKQADIDLSRQLLEGAQERDPSRMDGMHAHVRKYSRVRLNRDQFLAALSLVHVASAKSILRNSDRSVPHAWLVVILRQYHFGRSFDVLQRLASSLLSSLQELGLLICTDVRFAPRRARRYAITGDTFKLPFVDRSGVARHRRTCAAAIVRVRERQAEAAALPKLADVAHSNSLSTTRYLRSFSPLSSLVTPATWGQAEPEPDSMAAWSASG